MVISLLLFNSACAEKETVKVTELSLENYSQYLVINAGYTMSGKKHNAEQKGTVYDSATLSASCKSKNPDYKFYDTTVTVVFDGYYYPWKQVRSDYYGLASGTYNEFIEEEYKIQLDNNGNGESSGEIKFIKPTADLREHLNQIHFSVVDVQGKVAPMQ